MNIVENCLQPQIIYESSFGRNPLKSLPTQIGMLTKLELMYVVFLYFLVDMNR